MPESPGGDLCFRIADGETIDWGTAAAEELGGGGVLEALQLIERLSRAHREAADSLGHSLDPRSRERWGHLEVLEPLGAGSYGQVFRARDPYLDREVALKLLDTPSLQEGRLLAQIRHPNVVTVYGSDLQEGRAGLWMELVDGHNLAEIVQADGPFEPAPAVEIVREVCKALATVHAAGILHRDVKAQNVMRELGGRIVLTDFGIGHRASEHSDPRAISGTPAYLAPEVLHGEAASPQAEVYSVGVLLFFLLTGRFPVEAESFDELVGHHEAGRRQLLEDLRPGLPEGLSEIVERALSPDPAERFPTVEELGTALSDPMVLQTVVQEPPRRRVDPPRPWVAGILLAGLAVSLLLLTPRFLSREAGGQDSTSTGTPLGDTEQPAAERPGSDPGATVLDRTVFGGKSYLLIGAPDGSGINWTDSEAFAQSLGGHLVTVDSQDEQEFLAHKWGIDPDTPYEAYALWIGLQDTDGTDTFSVWADGTPVDYTSYYPGQPDQAAEDYIAMWVDWGGCGISSAGNLWFDTPDHSSNSCGLGKHYYGIVEVPHSAVTTAPLGMVSWWPADGGAVDIVGQNHATMIGASLTVEGKVGGAFRLGDGLGWVEVPDHPSLRLQRFTIEGWVYLGSPPPATLIAKGIAGTTLSSIRIWIDDGVNVEISDGSTSPVFLRSRIEPPLQEYFHLALSWDGDAARLYLDGEFAAAQDPADFVIGYSGAPLLIGADASGADHAVDAGLDGRIDELAIFDRALTRREIAHIYAAAGNGKWRDLDGDGIADGDDECPGTPSGETVNEAGCSAAAIIAAHRDA